MPDDINNSNDKSCSDYNLGTDIIEHEQQVYGEVFYNSGIMFLKFNEIANGLAEVNLYETTGRLVADYQLNVESKKDHQIDLNALGTGIYIANIIVNNEVISYQFAVK